MNFLIWDKEFLKHFTPFFLLITGDLKLDEKGIGGGGVKILDI